MSKSRIIDADAHFIEPLSLFPKYLEPAFKSIAPRLVKDPKGQPQTLILEQLNLGYTASESDTPASRLKAMDDEGIDVMIMYPTLGLFFGGLPVSEASSVAALCRAYNNWTFDYCSANSTRLLRPAMVPQMSVAETLKEVRRCVMELGCKGAFLRPNAIAGRTFNHPAWEPLWDLLEELDTPLVLHEGTAGHHPEVGVERYTRENSFFMHLVSHPFEHMMAMAELACGGVLERHPGLRVLHVEAGCGWLPYWLERMDHHVGEAHYPLAKLKELPSEYVRRQCLVSADPEEEILPQVVAAVGDDLIAFSTDFPHPDHKFAGICGLDIWRLILAPQRVPV